MNKILALDFFKQAPRKFTEQTVLGSLLTILAIGLSAYLIFYELSTFFTKEVKSELVFSDLKMPDLEVNIDIDLPKVPCEFADIRFVGQTGRTHHFKKTTLYRNGSTADYTIGEERDPEDLANIIARQSEGCNIVGQFYKHFLVDNFVVVWGNDFLLMRTRSFKPHIKLDLSHRINSLYLGDQTRHEELEKEYGLSSFNVLRNRSVIETKRTNKYNIRHKYYLWAVPTLLEGAFLSKPQEILQYAPNYFKEKSEENEIMFQTAVTPTAINYSIKIEGLWSTLANIFSVVGGLYMIFKVTDTLVYNFCSPKNQYTEVSNDLPATKTVHGNSSNLEMTHSV